jgi:hypothetical protein
VITKRKAVRFAACSCLYISRNLGFLRVFGTRWTALIAIITATYRNEIGKNRWSLVTLKTANCYALNLIHMVERGTSCIYTALSLRCASFPILAC